MKSGQLLLLVLAGLFLVYTFTRSRRTQREAALRQDSVRPGVQIMTTSGLYATVVEVADQRIVLETGPGQTSTWDRRAVARVITEDSSSSPDRSTLSSGDQTGTAETTGEEPPAAQ